MRCSRRCHRSPSFLTPACPIVGGADPAALFRSLDRPPFGFVRSHFLEHGELGRDDAVTNQLSRLHQLHLTQLTDALASTQIREIITFINLRPEQILG